MWYTIRWRDLLVMSTSSSSFCVPGDASKNQTLHRSRIFISSLFDLTCLLPSCPYIYLYCYFSYITYISTWLFFSILNFVRETQVAAARVQAGIFYDTEEAICFCILQLRDDSLLALFRFINRASWSSKRLSRLLLLLLLLLRLLQLRCRWCCRRCRHGCETLPAWLELLWYFGNIDSALLLSSLLFSSLRFIFLSRRYVMHDFRSTYILIS